jgi:ABC-2 type transport system permease protein
MPLAACAVWLGRNESLYDYWFYVINFSRYPMEIYRGTIGTPLRLFFTFAIPVLIVVNVPARLLAKPLTVSEWRLAVVALFSTAGSLLMSRWIFRRALLSYRSASS